MVTVQNTNMAGKITQHLTAFLRAAAVRGSAEDRAEVNELAKKLNVDLAAVDFALPQKPQHGGSVCAGSPASTRGPGRRVSAKGGRRGCR